MQYLNNSCYLISGFAEQYTDFELLTQCAVTKLLEQSSNVPF